MASGLTFITEPYRFISLLSDVKWLPGNDSLLRLSQPFDAQIHDIARLQILRWMHSEADPGGCPRADYVSREQGHKLTYVAHNGRDVENHFCSIAVLAELVVHFQPHVQAAGVGYLITSGKKRADGSERIRTLALHPLAATLELEAPFGVVIVKCVAGDELERLFLCYVGGGLSHDHCQFHFPIQLLGISGNTDKVIGADNRRGSLHENYWFPRHFLTTLGGMVAVVEPDADDFAWPADRRPQTHGR